MSSMETPEDPHTAPLSRDEIRRGIRRWLLGTSVLITLAVLIAFCTS